MNPITKLRKEHGYTQTQLAELLGVHQTAISQWELGRTLPDIPTMCKITLIFGVSIESLLSASEYGELFMQGKSSHYKEIIEKYEELDVHGAEIVDAILNLEYKRCIDESMQAEKQGAD